MVTIKPPSQKKNHHDSILHNTTNFCPMPHALGTWPSVQKIITIPSNTLIDALHIKIIASVKGNKDSATALETIWQVLNCILS